MIFLVVLLAVGVFMYIKPKVESTIFKKEVTADSLGQSRWCTYPMYQVYAELTSEEIPSAVIQQMYSNLDNKIEFTIGTIYHTSRTSFRITKVFYKDGNREVELNKENGTVWNAISPQNANVN